MKHRSGWGVALRTAILVILFLALTATLLALTVSEGRDQGPATQTPGPRLPSPVTTSNGAQTGDPVAPPTVTPVLVGQLPACAAVWRVGRYLPWGYRGCQTPEVTYQTPLRACWHSSRGVASSPDGSLHAPPGGVIVLGKSHKVAC